MGFFLGFHVALGLHKGSVRALVRIPKGFCTWMYKGV